MIGLSGKTERSMRLLVLLIGVGSVPTWAEPTQWALGLQIKPSIRDGIGLWRVNQEVAWGMEIGRTEYTASDVDLPQPPRPKDDQRGIGGYGFLHRSGLSPPCLPRHHPLSVLSSGHFNRVNNPHEPHAENRTTTRWRGWISFGIGVAWAPFDQVELWISQGAGFTFNQITLYKNARTRMYELGVDPIRVAAFFVF